MGYATDGNFFLNQQINRKVRQTMESGLMNYWMSKYPLKNISTSAEPEVLTLEQTLVGFKIWLVCVFVSTMAFLMEHVKYNFIDRIVK